MVVARKDPAMPLVIAVSAAAGALYACHAGEDINWDWQNYHEYAGFALLYGRFDIDVAPGGFQSYLNPLIYVLPYLARHGLGAPWSGVALGALHGLNIALIYRIARVLLGRDATPLALLSTVVIAAFGPMTLSEVGTSFADILTALPIVAGLALLLSDEGQGSRRLTWAGLLIGAAAGLKLTNATYMVGAVLCLLLSARPLASMLRLGAGGAAGMLATGGVWAFGLWRAFGSPLFPFYNTVFRAPDAPLAAMVDTRFMPNGLLDALAYPFDWLIGLHPSSEWPFRDPRFAVVIVLLLAMLIVAARRQVSVLRRTDKQFLLFFGVSYVLWLCVFAIQRYALPLELLTAPLIVLLVSRLMQAGQGGAGKAAPIARIRATQIVTVIAALAIALWSQPADWMRRPWRDPYRPQLTDALQQPAIFILVQKPLGYIVPMLPAGSRAYQISDVMMPIVPGGVLDKRIRDGIADPLPGGAWALFSAQSPADNPPRLELLDGYDLKIDRGRACARIPGAERIDIEACPLVARTNAAGE
jgi:hypothetical protein